MKLTPGSLVTIEGDGTQTKYRCHAHDQISDRYWLGVTDPGYDGYAGDLIIVPGGDGYIVVLCSDRSHIRGQITLNAAN